MIYSLWDITELFFDLKDDKEYHRQNLYGNNVIRYATKGSEIKKTKRRKCCDSKLKVLWRCLLLLSLFTGSLAYFIQKTISIMFIWTSKYDRAALKTYENIVVIQRKKCSCVLFGNSIRWNSERLIKRTGKRNAIGMEREKK